MALLRHLRTVGAALLLASALAFAPPLHAEDGLRLHEDEIKAGLLYNFLKYIEWPAAAMNASDAITLCIFGDDAFGGRVQPMTGRIVNQHAIAVVRPRNVQETAACHLLLIPAEAADRWPELRQALAGKNILTVGDFPRFAESGGIIEFGHDGNRMRITLNMDAAAAAHLHIQDRLLRLVTVVHPTAADRGP